MPNQHFDKANKIFATAVLKANKNILDTPVLTTKNIKTFKSSDAVKKAAIEILRKLGFTIEAIDALTISISGNKQIFEDAVEAPLLEKEINGITYYTLSKPISNAVVKKYITDIVFADAIELF
jgi:hypothetical protein